MVTLHHFTFPRWLRAKGGWESPDAAPLFARYTARVYAELGDGVRDWVTINEPMVHVLARLHRGECRPGLKLPLSGIVPVLVGCSPRTRRPTTRFTTSPPRPGARRASGVAHHLRTMDPAEPWNPLDLLRQPSRTRRGTGLSATRWKVAGCKINMLWLLSDDEEIPGLKGTQDFVGVNYYTAISSISRSKTGSSSARASAVPKSDLGWDIYPEGFARVLEAVGKRWKGKPVIITENGIADATDAQRPAIPARSS